MKLGTYDHYFDIADLLEDLGSEFILAVKHESGNGVIVLSNVGKAEVASAMLRAMDRELRDRFNPNPEAGDGI